MCFWLVGGLAAYVDNVCDTCVRVVRRSWSCVVGDEAEDSNE